MPCEQLPNADGTAPTSVYRKAPGGGGVGGGGGGENQAMIALAVLTKVCERARSYMKRCDAKGQGWSLKDSIPKTLQRRDLKNPTS